MNRTQIISPKTNRLIYTDGKAYKQLVKEGYINIISSNFNSLPDEIIEELLFKMEYNDIIALCNTKKQYKNICNEKFWKKL